MVRLQQLGLSDRRHGQEEELSPSHRPLSHRRSVRSGFIVSRTLHLWCAKGDGHAQETDGVSAGRIPVEPRFRAGSGPFLGDPGWRAARHRCARFNAAFRGRRPCGDSRPSRTRLSKARPRSDESSDVAEALPAGRTASPCDIAKTSETLDGFAVDSSTVTTGHGTIIKAIATCLLALRAGPRPIRIVDISGFTDTNGTGSPEPDSRQEARGRGSCRGDRERVGQPNAGVRGERRVRDSILRKDPADSRWRGRQPPRRGVCRGHGQQHRRPRHRSRHAQDREQSLPGRSRALLLREE